MGAFGLGDVNSPSLVHRWPCSSKEGVESEDSSPQSVDYVSHVLPGLGMQGRAGGLSELLPQE